MNRMKELLMYAAAGALAPRLDEYGNHVCSKAVVP